MKSHFVGKIMNELKAAGYVFARVSRNSHMVFRNPSGKIVTLPPKLEDINVANEIRKRAGLTNG